MRDTIAYQRLAVLTNEQAADLSEEQRLHDDIARVQQLIDYRRHDMDGHNGQLAALYIATGWGRESRG